MRRVGCGRPRRCWRTRRPQSVLPSGERGGHSRRHRAAAGREVVTEPLSLEHARLRAATLPMVAKLADHDRAVELEVGEVAAHEHRAIGTRRDDVDGAADVGIEVEIERAVVGEPSDAVVRDRGAGGAGLQGRKNQRSRMYNCFQA